MGGKGEGNLGYRNPRISNYIADLPLSVGVSPPTAKVFMVATCNTNLSPVLVTTRGLRHILYVTCNLYLNPKRGNKMIEFQNFMLRR